MKEWVNDLNTTNARIVVSIGLAIFVVIVVTVGVTFMHWEPTQMQLKVLTGVGGGVLTMMGFDVLQFWTKRSTDSGLAAARNPNQPVITSIAPQQDGNTLSAPSSPGKPANPPMDPDLAAALQYGADRDARLAAGGGGTHHGEMGEL